MTALENADRRKQRIVSKKSFAKNFYAASPPNTHRRQNHRHRSGRDDGTRLILNKPVVDLYTAEAMETEVQRLFRDLEGRKKNPSVVDVCNALLTSAHVQDLFVEYTLACHEDANNPKSPSPKTKSWPEASMAFLESMMKRSMAFISGNRNRRVREEQRLALKYQLVNAINHLKNEVGSNSQFITSWDDAKRALGKIFCFEKTDGAARSLSSPLLAAADSRALAIRNQSVTRPSNRLSSPGVPKYVEQLRNARLEDRRRSAHVGLRPSQRYLFELARSKEPKADAVDEARENQLQQEYEKFLDRGVPDAVKQVDKDFQQRQEEIEQEQRELELQQQREDEARQRAASLMRPFTAAERELIDEVMNRDGDPEEVLYQCSPDSVQRKSLQTLFPQVWLNDEVIHFFLRMLAVRDEELCKRDANRLRSHFFKSFFITKLLEEGEGKYNYRNVKRWSKKVPGKDIFNLDKVIFPINVGGMHWVCAVAFIQKKIIRFYDSMGEAGDHYLKGIFQYLKDEHRDKKKSPLPDADSWQLVRCTPDTPRQLNGVDCGVFVCMFADFVSKDCPLVFNQSHINQCRDRIALSIIQGKAID